MPARDPFDRLLDRCEWQGDCLIWTGGTVGTKSTYGAFRPGTRQSDPKAYVHRWIFETTIGPIPLGHEVDHVRKRGCTSTLCINPPHLEAVTHEENSKRARLEVCRSGLHALETNEDVIYDQKGRRRGCRRCNPHLAAHYARLNGGQ